MLPAVPHCLNPDLEDLGIYRIFSSRLIFYTDPILVFFGTEIAYAPKQFFSALLRGFSGQKQMIFHFQPVRQKSCRIKPKLDQYNPLNPGSDNAACCHCLNPDLQDLGIYRIFSSRLIL